VNGDGANWSILSLCSQYSRLTMSLTSTDWTVYGRLHFLATAAVWLGYPSLGTWLGSFMSMHAHTLLQNNCHMHS
jgi:hypothetical protein